MYDVVVVGGGPIGSHVACKMAGMGYAVLVLEKKEKLGGRVICAGIIGRECFSYFDISDSVVLRQANSAKIFSPSGKIIKLWRKENQAYIIDRAAFDSSMLNNARAAGAEYIFNSKVIDIQVKDDRVVVETVSNGSKLSYEARVAVIAAGFGSKLVEKVGLGKIGDFVIGAQAEVEAKDVDEVEVYTGQQVAPGFFAWLVPTSYQKALVGLLSRRSPREHLAKLLSSLKAEGRIDYGDAVIGCRGISIETPPKTYSRRLIAVGDAAGQVKPTTGGGIYFGLLSAEIAACNLQRALDKDDLSARSLAGYQRQWKKKLGQELRMCYWARKLYEKMSDQQIDRIFDITIARGIDRALLEADDLSFDWHGRAIVKLARQKALTKTLTAMKIPFSITLG